jgi:hypothetical protein
MANPDADMVTRLSALAALTSGVNLFRGKMRRDGHVPQLCVSVLSSGGPAPIAYAGGTTTERRFDSLQIIVRANRDAFQSGQELAKSVYAQAHRAPLSGYLDVRATTAAPLYLGEDAAKTHEWSINLELWYEE